jgi:hypothetical protein
MKNTNKFLADLIGLGFYDNQKLSFSYMDITSLNKELKQLVRLLQNLKKAGVCPHIHIWVENQLLVMLLTKIFSIKNLALNIFITTAAPAVCIKDPSLVLILGVPYLKFNNTLVEKIFNSKNFLVVKINSVLETNSFFTYKSLNSLVDIKKFVFLSILIKKIFRDA